MRSQMMENSIAGRNTLVERAIAVGSDERETTPACAQRKPIASMSAKEAVCPAIVDAISLPSR